ncbi:MAG TPA: endonuclease III [Lacipirellulaceae bacterium]|jgi:endonuclease-3|nr:endonuclease III [Lacipirellulaceae bacterium]
MATAKRTTAAKKSVAKTNTNGKPGSAGKRPKPSSLGGLAKRRAQAARVIERLKADYPGATCALENETPFELLIATILSAQCTDARVNMVTPELFRKWPDAEAMAKAPSKALEKVIQSTGFFRNKAKNIKAASQALVERHEGEIPKDLNALVALPGVGRKTANVVLGTAFGMATGVVVDTHVTRLSKRLGLTEHVDAVKIEQDLMEIVPQEEWVDFSHRLIFHGRQICIARKPKCPECSMKSFCPKIGVEQPSKISSGPRKPRRTSPKLNSPDPSP